MAGGGGAIYVAVPATDQIWQIDTGADRVIESIRSPTRPVDVVYLDGQLWVSHEGSLTLTAIALDSETVAALVSLPGTPRGLAAGDARLWVTVGGSERSDASL
jgi:DNA-binding beta-propeller fold protein YncE